MFSIIILIFLSGLEANGAFFNKVAGYSVNSSKTSYNLPTKVPCQLACLAHCNRVSNCETAYYNKQTQTCSLYDSKIDNSFLDTQSYGIVFISKPITSIEPNNTSQESCLISPYNLTRQSSFSTFNGTVMSRGYGILEILNSTSRFIITDESNNRALIVDENGSLIKKIFVNGPSWITKSSKYIYITSFTSSVLQYDFDMNLISTVVSGLNILGIHYDLITSNLYIASFSGYAIYIYHTIDEITFVRKATINSSHVFLSIDIYLDRIYAGADRSILVYNKTSHNLIETMSNVCPGNIFSVRLDCIGNLIYSCEDPPKITIVGKNGVNSSLYLNGTFFATYETRVDSKNRLWVGGNNGFAILV